MSEENKENPTVKNSQLVNDLLMKPFSLGWTREVVRRLVTNNRTPNCDIYYFSPSKKRLRSLAEVKCNLTDGLSPECFSFKREPLGLSPDLETIRDAKARGKGTEKSKEKKRTFSSASKKQAKSDTEEEEVKDNEKDTKKKKTDSEEKDLKPDVDGEVLENGEKADTNSSQENVEMKEESENEPEAKTRRAKSNVKQSDETKTFSSKKKTKTKGKAVKTSKPVPLQSVKKRKSVLKKVMTAKQAKQAKLVASRKVLKGIVSRKVSPLKRKLSKAKIDKKGNIKTKRNKAVKLKGAKKSLKPSNKKTKNEVAKELETNETDKKSATRDLKSIVKKNIVKYREMRERQKLGVIKPQVRSPSRKIPVATVSRSRLEPISKNKTLYIKPLEKGWRRELVYRTNCAKAGQQADVYYFHPSGKKLRSFREISENLTQGLSIECFTFRKEPIGCGEPSEVIRNARSNQKN